MRVRQRVHQISCFHTRNLACPAVALDEANQKEENVSRSFSTAVCLHVNNNFDPCPVQYPEKSSTWRKVCCISCGQSSSGFSLA